MHVFLVLILAALTEEARDFMFQTIEKNQIFLDVLVSRNELADDKKLTKTFEAVVSSMINNARSKRSVMKIKSNLEKNNVNNYRLNEEFQNWQKLDILKDISMEQYRELKGKDPSTVSDGFEKALVAKIGTASVVELENIQKTLENKEIASTGSYTTNRALETRATNLGIKLPEIDSGRSLSDLRLSEKMDIMGITSLNVMKVNLKAIRDLSGAIQGEQFKTGKVILTTNQENFKYLSDAINTEIKAFQQLLKSKIDAAGQSQVEMKTLMRTLVNNEVYFAKDKGSASNDLRDANKKTILESKNRLAMHAYNRYQKIPDFKIDLPQRPIKSKPIEIEARRNNIGETIPTKFAPEVGSSASTSQRESTGFNKPAVAEPKRIRAKDWINSPFQSIKQLQENRRIKKIEMKEPLANSIPQQRPHFERPI